MLSKFIKVIILFYPSVPYFNIGFGDNTLFVLLSLLYLSTISIVRIDAQIKYLAFAIVMTFVSYVIHNFLGHDVEFKYTALGLRTLVFNMIIFIAIYNICKRESSRFILNGLFYGVIFSFSFGLLELVIPTIMAKDFIFHYPRSLNELGWLTSESARIRLLWSEPSYAGGWIVIFALPVILLIRNEKKILGNIALIMLIVFFLIMNPKSSILILLVSAIVTILFKHNLIKIILNFLKVTILIGIPAVIFQFLYEERAEYILSLIYFSIDMIFNYGFSMDYLLTQDTISSSQTIRLIKIVTFLKLMCYEPYTFIIGITPYGIDELITRNVNLVDNSILGLGNFSLSEKISFQSTIFESIAWYSIFYLFFIVISLKNYYMYLKGSFSNDFVNFLTMFVLVYLVIVINPHIVVSLYVLSFLLKKIIVEKDIKSECIGFNKH